MWPLSIESLLSLRQMSVGIPPWKPNWRQSSVLHYCGMHLVVFSFASYFLSCVINDIPHKRQKVITANTELPV